jgi:hypothetical protein
VDPVTVDGVLDVELDGGATVLTWVLGSLVGLGDGRGGMQPTSPSATASMIASGATRARTFANLTRARAA